MEFQLLGPVQARHGGTEIPLGRRRERCLLAVLLLEVGAVVPAERLIDLLWDGEPSPAARDNLRAHVSRLRQRVDPAGDGTLGVRILGRAGGYLADVPADRVDVHRFRAQVGQARAVSDPSRRSAQLRAALALWRGPLMSDVATDHLRDRIGRDLDEARMAATELAVAADLEAGRAVEAVVELTGLVRERPLREGLRAQLMLALYRCGRAAEALEVFRDGRARLVAELAIEPGPELQTLHERILARDPGLVADEDDGTDSDEPDSPVARHNDLPRDVADFTGRDAELLGIVAEQDSAATTVIISAIDGMAGIGKTALSVHAAHQLAARYPDAALFIDLRAHTAGQEPVTPAVALDRLLRALGVAAGRIPDGLDERAALWRAELASRRVIVVLDNAASAAQVRPLLPGTPGSLTLVTSRRRLTDLESAYHISLDVLPPTEAIDLFARVAGPERAAVEPEPVATVVRLCGYLPLAIRVAAARLRSRPTWTVAHLAQRLSEGQLRLGELVTGDISVAAAFTMSYERLNPDQQRVFRFLGLTPAAEFDAHLVAALAGTDPVRAGAMLEDLLDANLVAQPLPGRYRLHDLLREHAAALAARTEPEPGRRAATGRALDYYLWATAAAMALVDPRPATLTVELADPPATGPLADGSDALRWLDTEYASLMIAIQYAADHGWPAHTWQLAHLLQYYFGLRAHSADWLTSHQLALDSALALGDRRAEAHLRWGLGLAHRQVSHYDEALVAFGQALDGFRALGDRWGEAATLVSTGGALYRLGRFRESARCYEEALPLHTAAGDRRAAAVTLMNIGATYEQLGQLDESIDRARRALAVFVELGDRRAEAMAVSNIAVIEEQRGNYEEALRGYRRSLDLLEALDDRATRGGPLTNIGIVLRRLGRFDEAISYHQRAVATVRDIGDRSLEAEFRNDLGNTLCAAGRFEAAAAEFRSALALATELEVTHERARAHHGLGAALRDAAPAAAAEHWERAITLYDGDRRRVEIEAIRLDLAALP